MRVGQKATGKTNCILEAPNFGRFSVMIETVGYGMQVLSSEGMTRNNRTFYPFVRTGDAWYVEAVFAEVAERNGFHGWLLRYIVRSSDQYNQPLLPITVTIPKANFVKTGYITSNVAFGDKQGQGVYRSIVQFVSATDPALAAKEQSVYTAPKNNPEAFAFYPSGRQDRELPPPQPDYVINGGSPFESVAGETIRVPSTGIGQGVSASSGD